MNAAIKVRIKRRVSYQPAVDVTRWSGQESSADDRHSKVPCSKELTRQDVMYV